MAQSVWAIEIKTRSIGDTVRGKPFKTLWRYYPYRWIARMAVWWINTCGAGPDYERAKFLGETL